MAWPLYYLKKYQLPVSDKARDLVYESRDCIALVCLYSLGSLKDQIIQFANGLVCKTNYEKDQYWLLLYQLYREDLTNDVYEDNQVFKVMKENEVNFLPESNDKSIGERYCDYLNNPFTNAPVDENHEADVEDEPYDEWCKKYKDQEVGCVIAPHNKAIKNRYG